ncbi:HAD family phosphatase [Azospirillum sp. TSO22-1]|uniref:HAD family hydrolase n=1 Tax=Azospirillum sp. TSO22-1 TaxID=716789 RepID=UPI000D622BC8|nr:HAD family phosphatase [Azospirillum sp. TSO22-1]PWC56816.1 2-haloalkanoic acid dehalogenase [Azospirillum sp. TSO22-1]
MTIRAVVFDIGNVLIEWDPRHLYREFFDDQDALMEDFLSTVCTPAWNLELDRGQSWDEGVAALVAEYPDCAELIRAYRERWHDMVPGEIPGTPELLEELKARGVPLYALSNFSREKYVETRERYPSFDLFDGLVISGEVRLVKPDPAIWRLLLERYGLDPAAVLYIDDLVENCAVAEGLGMRTHRFSGAAKLRAELEERGVL